MALDVTPTPPWLAAAQKEIGVHEEPENRGPAIRRYINLAQCGAEGDPWCAIFMNAMLEQCGIRGTRSPSSQSFAHDANFMKLSDAAYGAIAVFWRISQHSGLGHVGIYTGERNGFVWVLGGNESGMVQIEAMTKAGSHFGLVGYYWPRNTLIKPTIGQLVLARDVPTHITTPKVT